MSAVTHDHGDDITKAIRLTATHTFLCIDHELDLSVKAGIVSVLFGPVFTQASEIVALRRNCKNLYRKLRDEQVSVLDMFEFIHRTVFRLLLSVLLFLSFFDYVFLFTLLIVVLVDVPQHSYGYAFDVCHDSLAV